MLYVPNRFPAGALAFGVVLATGLVGVAPAAHAQDVDFRDCRTCHMVEAPDGQLLERGGRSGPNLYGVTGRVAGSDTRFRHYSDAMQAAGAAGVRWTESNFVSYMGDPDGFLREATGNSGAQADMHVSLRNGAREMYQYLQGLSQ